MFLCNYYSIVLSKMFLYNNKHPKQKGQQKAVPLIRKILFSFHLSETVTAVYRAVFAWSERNFCFCSAACASRCEHFSLCSGSVFAVVAACFASLRLIYKAFFCIEFLFTCREYELRAAVLALQSLVLIHCFLPRF